MKYALLLLARIACAQIDVPSIGLMRDSAGTIRPLLGIAGSFVRGEPLLEGAISAAVFQDRVLLKLDRSIKLLDSQGVREFDAPEGPATFSLNLVWFAADRTLWRIENDGLKPIPLLEDIAALGEDSAIIRRGEMFWCMRLSGELLESFPDRRGPVIILDGGKTLWADQLEIDNVLELAPLGPGWIHVRTAESSYALRLSTRRLFLLP